MIYLVNAPSVSDKRIRQMTVNSVFGMGGKTHALGFKRFIIQSYHINQLFVTSLIEFDPAGTMLDLH